MRDASRYRTASDILFRWHSLMENEMPNTRSFAPPQDHAGPLVSIIIPCYNGRQFISEAIESALAQSYSRVEILVIDDGSTDESPEIAQRYPVRLVRGTHLGVSAARNLGIRESHGEYLVFLDSDDRLLPGGVAAGLLALQQNSTCVMAVGAHHLISQSGERTATRPKPTRPKNVYELLLRSNFIECTASAVYRQSCFRNNFGFKHCLRGAEDYDLYLRLARQAPICCHNQVVSEYRLHPRSASRNSAMMLAHTLAVVSEQWPFARKSLRSVVAYISGSLSWRRKYGRQLTVELAMSESDLSPQDAKAARRLLAHSYPQGLLVILISRMLPKTLVRNMLQRA